ncbi:hypothetical protein ACFFK0_28355 [Paenibacillus chartarius]|uniref:DUF4190 domain-containing protein n=1 Tax=Paenibacillus chartarius TaxID=747481 RepID=A0ABV6DUH5_9BACL
MNSDHEQSESPSVYGRKQFEREASVGGARDEEYASELTPTLPGTAVQRGEAMRRYDTPRIPVAQEGTAGVRAAADAETRRGDGDGDALAAIGALVEDDENVATRNKSLGIAALVLAAISLFFLPAVLGPASIVVGFAAFVRGNRTLGVWSMALGLLAVAAYYVLVPYYT